MPTTADIIAARVKDTDKMRIRFCLQNFTENMQGVIYRFFMRKWQNDVIVVRWPRMNIVEVRLSNQMIRTAGFIEVTQEVRRYWQAFLRLVRKEELILLRTKLIRPA